MLKKAVALCLVLASVFVVSSCRVENKKDKISDTYSFTQRVTYIHNHFKDSLPEFKFENDPVERYEDGMSFVMNVVSSQKEFDKYKKKLVKEGFDQELVEAQTYFSAVNGNGLFVKATYVGDMLTVMVKSK